MKREQTHIRERNITPTELHRNNIFLRHMYVNRTVMKKYKPVVWDRRYNANKEKKQGTFSKAPTMCHTLHIFSCIYLFKCFHMPWQSSSNQKQKHSVLNKC